VGKGKRVRRAGSPWRILVHEALSGGRSGKTHHVTSHATFGGSTPDSDLSKTHVIDGTEFDELVVGHWIHVEQMDSRLWWMNIAGVTINVRVDRDGRAYGVDVYGPGDYASAEYGVRYTLAWSHDNEFTGSSDDR
jgi:hypothetical protein